MQYLSVGAYPSKCTAFGRDSKPRNIHSRQLGTLDHHLAEAEDALPITLGALSVPPCGAELGQGGAYSFLANAVGAGSWARACPR